MKVDFGIWSWLRHAVIALVVLAILIFIFMTYVPLIQRNERMRRNLDQLQAEQDRQTEIFKQRRAEIEALRHDPQTVARLIREKLPVAKPEETIFRFEAANTNSGR
jgi:cell division protein FtsB